MNIYILLIYLEVLLCMFQKCVPSPSSLTEAIAGLFQSPRDDDVTVMVEPGRSIVGDAGALVTSVLGCKMSGAKRYEFLG